jgi:hypothetical protein
MGRPTIIVARDDEHARIEFDPSKSKLTLTWKGYVPSADFRAALMQGVGLVEQHGLHYWLSDSRTMGPILREDELWVKEQLLPRMFKAGLVRLAIIAGKDYFYSTTANRIVGGAQPASPYPMNFFEDQEKADAWLFQSTTAVA